jgi:Na+/H+-translocating membrane pyrophosphatase
VHPGTSGAREILEFMKIIIVIAFVAIIASLMSALFFMMRDKGQSRNTVRALTVRVALSACLFIFLLVISLLYVYKARILEAVTE